MKYKELIKSNAVTEKFLSERFGIPCQTIENWSRGISECPEYVVGMIKEILKIKKYEVDYTDSDTGATEAIDTIVEPESYTAAQYIADCKENADSDWNEMLADGEVTLIEIG